MVYVTYIETERGESAGTWELTRTIENIGSVFLIDGERRKYLEEITIWEDSPQDRLLAAIVNLGLACRWYFDRGLERVYIEIRSDADGKDCRYENEHRKLYDLLCPRDDWAARKNASLYGEYNKYLRRVRELVRTQQIIIQYGDDGSERTDL